MTGSLSALRVRWAAIGAAIAVSLGAGGLSIVDARSSGEQLVFTSVAPCRLEDTRVPPAVPERIGSRNTPLRHEDAFAIKATGSTGKCAGVPADAEAVELNVTAVNATEHTFLTIWPGGTRPLASSLNPIGNHPPLPNSVTVKLAGDGTFWVYNHRGSVNVVVDLVGYYQPAPVGSGAPGPQGPAGDRGPRGFSAWDTIPSGRTVTGTLHVDTATHGGTDSDQVTIDLPGVAPNALTATTVNFAPHAAASDGDPACTGTAQNPTAPPGKVCIYIASRSRIQQANGFASPDLPRRAFSVDFTPTTATPGLDMWIRATWAYTAP